jgi:hypothetical protein
MVLRPERNLVAHGVFNSTLFCTGIISDIMLHTSRLAHAIHPHWENPAITDMQKLLGQ